MKTGINGTRSLKIIVGITGASGAILGERLVRFLLEDGHEVHAIISPSGVAVFDEELGIKLGKTHEEVRRNFMKHYKNPKKLYIAPADDFASKVSSGSSEIDAMVICPCSMSTAAAIAHGLTLNLIHRAASVSIKEKRPFIIVPRESPMSTIHLRNLLTLSEVGVHVVPATTAFYHNPKTVGDMVDFVVMKVLDLAGVAHGLDKRWKGIEAD